MEQSGEPPPTARDLLTNLNTAAGTIVKAYQGEGLVHDSSPLRLFQGEQPTHNSLSSSRLSQGEKFTHLPLVLPQVVQSTILGTISNKGNNFYTSDFDAVAASSSSPRSISLPMLNRKLVLDPKDSGVFPKRPSMQFMGGVSKGTGIFLPLQDQALPQTSSTATSGLGHHKFDHILSLEIQAHYPGFATAVGSGQISPSNTMSFFYAPAEQSGSQQRDKPYPIHKNEMALKHTFLTRSGGLYSPTWKAEFAAFTKAGESVQRKFRDIKQELKSLTMAAPTSYYSQRNDKFRRAGQVYVAYLQEQYHGISDTQNELDTHDEFSIYDDFTYSYTEEDYQWARGYLTDEVKIWLKRRSGIIAETEHPASKWANKALGYIIPETSFFNNHLVQGNSQETTRQFPKATVDKLQMWSNFDTIMSLSELDREWDALEKANPSPLQVLDDTQALISPQDMLSTSTPSPLLSFLTIDDDEVSMVPSTTLNHDVLPSNASTGSSPKFDNPGIGPSAARDSSLRQPANKLSDIPLSNVRDNAIRSDFHAVGTNSIRSSARGESHSNHIAKADESSDEIADKQIEEYDSNLFGHRVACGEGSGIERDFPSPTGYQDFESVFVQSSNTDYSDTQTRLPKISISLDPRFLSRDARAVSEDRQTPIVSIPVGKATGDTGVRVEDRTTNTLEPVVGNHIKIPITQRDASVSYHSVDASTTSSQVSIASPRILNMSSADSDTTQYKCAKCNKAYKTESSLLKHAAKGHGKTTPKRSMAECDVALPSLEVGNYKSRVYCTACNAEFSGIGRLKRHTDHHCPAIVKNGVHELFHNQTNRRSLDADLNRENTPAMVASRVGNRALALGHLNSTAAGSFEWEERVFRCSKVNLEGLGDNEFRTETPCPLSKLKLSDPPVNVVNVDNAFAHKTTSGPSPSPTRRCTRSPVSTRNPKPLRFREESWGLEQSHITRQEIDHLDSQQVKHLNLALPADNDNLLVMEEAPIGEKVHKGENMVDVPAPRYTRDPSPFKSEPLTLKSAISLSQTPASTHMHGSGRSTPQSIADHNSPISIQIDIREDPKLPRISVGSPSDDRQYTLTYPARTRLFSNELSLSSLHTTNPLVPFTDLPKAPKNANSKQFERPSPNIARSKRCTDSMPQAISEGNSSAFFSFTNKRLWRVAVQKLQETILMSYDPTLQSLKVWPSPDTSGPTFEFKITGPDGVDIIAQVSDLFPGMARSKRGEQIVYVVGNTSSSDSSSLPTVPLANTGALATVPAHTEQLRGREWQDIQQPRRSSRVRAGSVAPNLNSQTMVNTNTGVNSQDSKGSKKRRSSARLAEMIPREEKAAENDKKRQRTNK